MDWPQGINLQLFLVLYPKHSIILIFALATLSRAHEHVTHGVNLAVPEVHL